MGAAIKEPGAIDLIRDGHPDTLFKHLNVLTQKINEITETLGASMLKKDFSETSKSMAARRRELNTPRVPGNATADSAEMLALKKAFDENASTLEAIKVAMTKQATDSELRIKELSDLVEKALAAKGGK